ncbi:TAF-domain-containing protein [Coniophora puteana RWD-64-598 SS2]|uniref:TBP-associated factor 6 n=1 Tax=Coniophora puteana (strain RWD-64-598) TaxID=741705 RepID=A0A5M3MPJ4_CONPW|nr:TAF-domain-containing protein [Coniophora puteana RWD-64-598 SS2]EIW81112.1 TAF-domain-containing protein [Coniophora puteana RWD-64-598 SS2]
MSKAKGKSVGGAAGVYRPEAVQDVAESVGISSLSDSVASALASDVEYRIQQVIEEAARFMRHARRTTLTTADMDNALRTLNIEPLYGFGGATVPPPFRRAAPFPHMQGQGHGPIYFIEDDEVDFDRVLREEKITVPRGVSWAAHWLAVEGVQPLIPENPPAVPRDSDQPPQQDGAANTAALAAQKKPQQQQQQQQQLVKQVLSRELQLYYARLTASLLPPTDNAKRTAALASLRSDAGLQALLPYLVKWIGEGVVNVLREGSGSESDGRTLEVLLDAVSAILENNTLFVEPYLHQILPPLLSTLLHTSLPPTHASHLRATASSTLARVLTTHSTTYPSLTPRITKTLLLALLGTSTNFSNGHQGASFGTRIGAIRGLGAIGKEAVRKGLVEGGGARVLGKELENRMDDGDENTDGTKDALVDVVMNAFRMLHAPSDMPEAMDPSSPEAARLMETVGEFFAQRLVGDCAWAMGILGETPSS